METNTDFNVISLNVRGLRSLNKRRGIFLWLTKQKADIVFLQETYSTFQDENFWKTQWKGRMLFSHGSNHSKGALILVRQGLDFEQKTIECDPNGRFIFLEALVQGSLFLFVNLYAPNKVHEQETFFKRIETKLESFDFVSNRKIIIGGDLNVYFNEKLDCSGGRPKIKEKSVNKIKDIMSANDLIDVWRIRHPDKQRFTWRQATSAIQRRLDYWLISDSCQEEVFSTDIIPAIKTDHSAITLNFKSIAEYTRGPSYWKFNSSLVDDPVYTDLINHSYPVWLEEYKEITSKRLLWDIIKYRIRKETISYSKRKARERRDQLSALEKEVKCWEEKCDEFPTVENLSKLEEKRIQYESAYDYVTQGSIIRSRARWFEKGEKNNRYFLRLESYNNSSCCIRKLKLDDNSFTTDPSVILAELKSFYSSLYQKFVSDNAETVTMNFLNNQDIPKLDEEEKEKCEGKLTFNECFRSLLTFQNGKAPGNDGLTVEFYKSFWPLVGHLVVDSLNEAYDCGELSTSQKMAIIKLIEKKGKDKLYIKNWRPISLLNVDVKIASKALAKRLEPILPLIIHKNQNAYVKGRSIFDSTRIIDDIMFFTKENNLSGLLLAIDFEKAFDSLDWKFLTKALSAFNFGSSFIKWVNTFYSNIQSCVMNNGFSSVHFDVLRGVRQGDPLSAYLFIIALEILAINIRSSENIRGIKLRDGQEVKLTAFADDMTTFLLDKESIDNLFIMLDDFGICSGLKLNRSKLEAISIGSPSTNLNINFDLCNSIKILGIFFSYNAKEALRLNFESILESLKKKLNLWKWRNLTILGRIQIVKTFAISKFLYRASQISFPKEIIKSANTIIYDFIWKGKDKVKRRALINNIENGGLKMLHLESLIEAQKISFFKRYADPDYAADWKFVLDTILEPVGGPYLLNCNFDLKVLPVALSPFYRECLTLWAKLNTQTSEKEEDLLNEIIWNNRNILVNKKSFYISDMINLGIHKISDIVKPGGTFLTWFDLQARGLQSKNFLLWCGLIDALPLKWKQILRTVTTLPRTPFVPTNFTLLLKSKRLTLTEINTKKIYDELVSDIRETPTAQIRFNEMFSGCELDWNKIYSLPFQVALDTYTRDFQYKLLNGIIFTNTKLCKFGLADSPLCTFCGNEEETPEHLFILCNFSKCFWQEISCWLELRNIHTAIDLTIPTNIMFGLLDINEHFMSLNHVILIAKQTIFLCRRKNIAPNFNIFLANLKKIVKIEEFLAKQKNKMNLHLEKWKLFVELL